MPFIKRLDIWYARLPQIGGSCYRGIRPVVIVQNDIGNEHSPTVIVVPLTSRIKRLDMPTHTIVTVGRTKSVACCEQIMTLPVDFLCEKIGMVIGYKERESFEKALKASIFL